MSSQLPTPDPLNPVNIDCSVSDQPANVTLQKSVLSFPPFFAGKVVKYQLKIQNTGGQNIKNLVLLESVSPITITEDQLGITEEPICLNAGFTSFVEYEYTLTEEDVIGPFTNIATISSTTNEIEPVTASQTLDVSIPSQLSIQKSVTPSGPYTIGDTLNFTVLISSFGGDTDIDFVRLTDTLVTEKTGSDQLTITQDTANLLQGNLTSLTPDQSLEIQYSYTIQPEDYPGGFSNTATVTYDDDNKQKTASLNITDILRPGEIAISKTAAPGPYESGVNDVITFTVSVSNIGEGPVNVPQLEDSIGLPGQDFTLISDVSGLFAAGNTQILGGGVAEATYEYTIPLENFASGTITNEVVAGGKSASVTIDGLIGNPYIFNIDTTYIEVRDFQSGSGERWLQTSTNKNMFNLPLLPPTGVFSNDDGVKYGVGIYNILVDWGENDENGNPKFSLIKEWDNSETLHVYNEPGVKQIKIYGDLTGWSFNNKSRITSNNLSSRLIKWYDKDQTLPSGEVVTSEGGVFYEDKFNNQTRKEPYILDIWQYLNNDIDGFKGLIVPREPQDPINDPDQYAINKHVIHNTDFSNDYRLSDRVKYLDTISWGRLVITGGNSSEDEVSSQSFKGCKNYTGAYSLQDTNIGRPEFYPGVVDIQGFFQDCISFNGYVDNWDLGNIRGIANMFDGCLSFNRNLNSWDVSNIVNMAGLFNNCRIFNKPLDNWGPQLTNLTGSLQSIFNNCFEFDNSVESWGQGIAPGAITNMSLAFQGCGKFNHPLNSWGPALSSCVSFRDCFKNCSIFNQPLDLWETGTAKSFQGLFQNCRVFNQNIDNWNVSNMENMQATFAGCRAYNQPLSSWGPQLGNLTALRQTFTGCTSFNQNINSWGPYMGKVQDLYYTFKDCRSYNQPMNTWNISNVRSMFATFSECVNFNQDLNDWADNLDPGQTQFKINNLYITWSSCSSLGKNAGDVSFSKWGDKLPNAGRVELTFRGCPLKGDCGFGTWIPTGFNSIKNIFSSTNINDSPGIDNWGPYLTNIIGAVSNDGWRGVFSGSNFNQPLPSWADAVGTAKRMDEMFLNTPFDQDIRSWDFSSVQGTILNSEGTGPQRDSRGRLLQPSLDEFLGRAVINNGVLQTSGFSQTNYDNLLIAFKAKHEAGEMNDRIWLKVRQARSAASNDAYNYLVDVADWDIVDGTVIENNDYTRNSGPV